MSDPSQAGFELGEWAWKALTALLGALGWNLMARTRKLEMERQTREDAAKQREELRTEIRELRTDAKEAHARIFERLDTIMERLIK